MKLAFLGTGEFATPALETLVADGHEVLVVISQPDRPAGRGKHIKPTPVRAAAERLGLRHIQAEDVNALDLDETFGGVELAVVAAFGQKLGPAILAAPKLGCVNIHGSLLPRYRGAAPFQWAIINGETTTGVTVFQLDERWDNGPIWGASETPIGETETADELHDRLAQLGARLIADVVRKIQSGDAVPTPQDKALASRAPKFKRADGVVDWTAPATRVTRRIHGLWSWPTATTLFVSQAGRRETVALARAERIDDGSTPTDGCPAGAVRADGAIQTGDGAVRLLEVKPAGGKLMSYDAFANGRRVRAGDRFTTLDEE